MHHTLKIIWILLFFIQGAASGLNGQFIQQDTIPEVPEYGEIPDSLFEPHADHDYPFEYLLHRVETRFSEQAGRIIAILDYHYRLRVLTDDPIILVETALIGIPYYYHDNIEEVIRIEGITFQPDGTAAELNEGDIRTAELNSRYRIKEFIMPDVREGSVLDYRYTIQRSYIEELPDFYFSNRVPTRLAYATIHNENYLRYDVVGSNLNFDVYYHEEKIDTSRIPLIFTYQRPEPVSKEHWYAYDVPVVESEAYISSINDLRGQLNFQISEFGRPRQPLENSWDFVAAQIRRGDENPYRFVEEMIELQNLGENLASDLTEKEEITEAIFNYVNRKKVFNGMKRAFHDTPIDNVLEGEPADQAAINLVLMAMLRGAGLQPKPVYLSGRNFGRINKEFPSIYQLNQMLIALEIPDGYRLMDASFSNSRPGLIPVDSYNETGMVFSENDYEWIELLPEYSVFDIDVDLSASLTEEGELSGSINILTGGYPVHEIREDMAGQTTAGNIIRDSFFDSYAEVEIMNAEIREKEPGEYPLLISADFTIPEYAVSFREGLQFSPLVVGYLQRNPFEQNERMAPITLDAPEIINLKYEIELPEGYILESLNESMATRMRGAELTEQYESSGRRISYKYKIQIGRREFSADEYVQLRRIYDRWVFLSNDEWFIQRRTNL
jgi:hypothetical protein